MALEVVDQALIEKDVKAYLELNQKKSLLRFITCGSVDDGKSTLIGRLLYDSKQIFDDQLTALTNDSKKVGTTGGGLDFALLVDGLAAEREQGITIDVAYRFFATEKRKFIVADTPGHEQYTRNMVTGASTADLAVILIDARKGVLPQTRRHSFLVSLVGIKRVVLAVTKMDLIGWDQKKFDAIVADFREFAAKIGLEHITPIPISGLEGDNISIRGKHAPWYKGPTLLEHLETVPLDKDGLQREAFRMPVQWVNRPDLHFRGFSGQIASGVVRPGDPVRVLPSGRTSKVSRIVAYGGDLPLAGAGRSVTISLEDEIDISRGDVIATANAPPETADQFETTLVWMADASLTPGKAYWLKIGAALVSAQIKEIEYKIDVNTLEHEEAQFINLNEICVAQVSIDRPIAFEPYAENSDLGGFILIDRASFATVGAGMITRATRQAHNIHWQALDVTRAARASIKGQRPAVLWFTGLSGAGKSTIANLVERKLHSLGRHTILLDGDNIRHGLNSDLSFSDADRAENIRRVAEVAKLMADAGLIVLVSFISPFRAERALARELMAPGEFVEIHVDTPLSVAEGRDTKGLYAKARSGELKNFTGIDSPYEAPERPEIRIDTTELTAPDAAEVIVTRITGEGAAENWSV
jgi:bifunctional enzyme CysN/CysC